MEIMSSNLTQKWAKCDRKNRLEHDHSWSGKIHTPHILTDRLLTFAVPVREDQSDSGTSQTLFTLHKKCSCNGRFKVFDRWVYLQVWGDCSLWVTMWKTFDSPTALGGGVEEQIFVYSIFLFLVSQYLARSLVTTHFTLHWCIWQMWVLRKAASACKGCCLKQTPTPNKC
jgi:hypothetical protein